MQNKDQDPQVFLSIAIPVYNQADTIQATIESALKAIEGQKNVEIVVSENFSTDSTHEIVSIYSNKIKIVNPPYHLDMAANWNFAVNSCSGKWVGMLSGDDKILPGYVQSIRRIVSKAHNAVFAFGGWNVVNASTGMVERRTVLSMPKVVLPKRSASSLIMGPKASFASYCFLKSAFEDIGGFSESYNLIQDWVLQFRLSLVGVLVKSDSVIAEYLTGQSRDDLECRRALLYVKDLVTFCCKDIWGACDVGVSRTSVLRACEMHAARAERILNRFPDAKNQGNIILTPLYALIGKERVGMNQKTSHWSFLLCLRRRFRECVQYFF